MSLDGTEASEPVLFVSKDGDKFALSLSAARRSGLFATILNGDSSAKVLSIEKFSSDTLTEVVKYLEHEDLSETILEKSKRKIFHPIRGNVKERKLENIKPEGTYSKWDSDFVYAVYTTPFQGRPSNGYHLQELWKAANYLDIKDLCALVCAQFAVHLASRGAREGQKLGVLGSASGQSFDAVEKSLIARGTPLQDQAWNQDEAGNWHHSPIFNEDGTPKIKHLKDVTEAEYAILKEANKWAWELRKSSVEEKSE